MANEPERPIEKLLRACAQRRRHPAPEGTEFQLHPATRRLLQGEVARRFARRKPDRSGAARRWWDASFWPRLAEACVLVALIAVVSYLLVPALRAPKGELRLARTQTPAPAAPLAEPAVPPAASAPAANAPDFKLRANRQELAAADTSAPQKEAPALRFQSNRSSADRESPAMADTTTAAPQNAPASALDKKSLKLESPPAGAPAPVAEPPAVAATVPAERFPGVAGTAGEENGKLTQNFTSDFAKAAKDAAGFAVRQRFTQVPPAEAKAAQSQAGPSILTSFQVQQAGQELRVIDSDGSVYTGSVQTASMQMGAADSRAPSGGAAPSAQSPTRSLLSAQGPPSPQWPGRFFRVTGTNRSLNQPVVFSGDLTRLTNGAGSGTLHGALSGSAAGGKPAPGLLLNTRISGQAVIGKDQVIEVNAVPAP